MSYKGTIPSHAIVRALAGSGGEEKRPASSRKPHIGGGLILAALLAAIVLELAAYFVAGGIW